MDSTVVDSVRQWLTVTTVETLSNCRKLSTTVELYCRTVEPGLSAVHFWPSLSKRPICHGWRAGERGEQAGAQALTASPSDGLGVRRFWPPAIELRMRGKSLS